jgi:hypothetical protein
VWTEVFLNEADEFMDLSGRRQVESRGGQQPFKFRGGDAGSGIHGVQELVVARRQVRNGWLEGRADEEPRVEFQRVFMHWVIHP